MYGTKSDIPAAAADQAKSAVGEVFDAGVRAASDIAAEGADAARRGIDQGKAAANERIDAARTWLENTTRDNPLCALGIAGTLGLVVGWLLKQRS